MTSPNALTEHNSLMKQLLQSIASETPLDEVSKARYLKKAQQLPDYEQIYTIESLIHTANYENEKAKETALKAYHYGAGSAVFMNTISTLCINGYMRTTLDILLSNKELAANPSYVPAFAAILTKAPSYELIMTLLNTIEVSQIDDRLGDTHGALMTLASFMHKGITKHGLEENVYASISEIAAQVTEEHNHTVINQCRIYQSFEENEMTMVFFVESAPEDVADLNWELAEKLIESGLDDIPLVARFSIQKELMPKVRSLGVS
ncbi:TPA: hypothetical protein O4G41_003791 [Vibrio alginolyticus]|uniref:hypothetical protein n=1 Tax=Vibrio TaxID=662 RepID=UPI00079A9292|nr:MULTISPECIES: hypothetical protein [Vibrio]EHH1259594.1 hypothetical protein [Vibrio parahaemolyticus]EIE5865658.1 hypothetical protein [Vibrio alginolyticus]EKA5859540.1 hypothetical protein [Vibrio alginolyticus]KXZ38514.1 hypothetical protein A0H77_01555 [Vibrio alginolyticus]MBS9882402.1 hypothetical protein [Vibrio alginolyticus]